MLGIDDPDWQRRGVLDDGEGRKHDWRQQDDPRWQDDGLRDDRVARARRSARVRSASVRSAVSDVSVNAHQRVGAVFENPAHDFPQEVGYRRDGDNLLAWIRGTQNGKERRIEFPYTRARCGNQ